MNIEVEEKERCFFLKSRFRSIRLKSSCSDVLMQSAGEKCGSAAQMVSHRLSMILAAALRRMAMSLENAFLIGLKSSELGGW